MENAVKALLIAAGALIGVAIITMGVTLYTSLSNYAGNVEENINSQELQKFNDQFVKYINCNQLNDDNVKFVLTIQDVVTAANVAYENNRDYNLDEYINNNFYVTVKLDNRILEKNINENASEELANGLGQEYRCRTSDVKTNEVTGRVFEVNFYTVTE